jgi:hypothetical protein
MMRFFRKVWYMASKLHPAFWVVPSFILGALVALLVNVDDKIAPAVITLLGVLIGGALTAAVGLAVASTTQRAQLTASIWPQRMKVHQEAFKHWARCRSVIFGDEYQRDQTLYEARMWWDDNCLYLSEEVSKHFFDMLADVRLHHHLVDDGRGKGDPAHVDKIKANFSSIMETGRVIADGAGRHISESFIKEIADFDEAMTPPADKAG